MSRPEVRFIIVSYTMVSEGADYTFAHITSTISGRRLFVQNAGGPENLTSKVRKFLQETQQDPNYPTLYSINVPMKAREWKRSNPTAGIWESQLTAQHIFELEQIRELQL